MLATDQVKLLMWNPSVLNFLLLGKSFNLIPPHKSYISLNLKQKKKKNLTSHE